MGVRVPDQGRSNDDIYNLLDRATQVMEDATKGVATRASKADMERLERALDALNDTLSHPAQGIVIRVDRLENHRLVDRVEKIEEILPRMGTLQFSDLAKIVGVVAVLLGAFWFVLDLYIIAMISEQFAEHISRGG
jgi:hypothetical protein